MGDHENQGDEAVPAGWGMGAPTAPPVLSGAYGVTEAPVPPPVQSSASRLPWIAAVVGAVVLLAGGSFFALTAFGAAGGADSPEAAVDALIEAANNEDFITIGELLDPGERRTIVEPTLTELLPELVRVGVLDERANAGDVEGFDWEFTNVTYRVEPIAQNPDMVHVFFTGGEAAAEFNSAEFPFGDTFRDRFGDDFEDVPRETEQIENSENPMVLVEHDGRWYVSGLFTIAENIRLEAGERLPDPTEAPRALGSSTPDAAVEAMFTEMVEMDLAGLIGRMDPEEMAVLYRYSPLFLDEGQMQLDELKAELVSDGVSWDMTDFDFDVEEDGDDAKVMLKGFTLSIAADDFELDFTYGSEQISGRLIAGDFGRGTFEATTTKWVVNGVVSGEQFEAEITIDPDTYTVTGSGSAAGETASGNVTLDRDGICSGYSVTVSDGTDEQGCLEDDFPSGQLVVLDQYSKFFDDLAEEFPGIPMSAHRTNGEWYVSPIGTGFNGYLSFFKRFEEGEFEEFMDSMEQVSDVPSSVAEEAFGGLIGDGGFSDSAEADIFELADEAAAEAAAEALAEAIDEAGNSFTGAAAEVGNEFTLGLDGRTAAGLSSALSSGTYDLVTVNFAAGDSVVITAETNSSSNPDTTLTLLDANGEVIGYNDDAEFGSELAGLFDSKLLVEIAETGTYTIEVRSLGDQGSGAYALSVQRS